MPRAEITTLLEERAGIWEQISALSNLAATEGRDLTADERTKYDGLMADFEAKSAHAERMQKEEGIAPTMTRAQALNDDAQERAQEQADVQASGGVKMSRAATLWGQVSDVRKGDEALEELRSIANKQDARALITAARRGGQDGANARFLIAASDDYRDAFVDFLRRGEGSEQFAEYRAALNVGTGAQGGYLVPVAFLQQLIVSERFFGVMTTLARHITTTFDGALTIPKVDDSNRMTAVWLAEGAAFTESEDQFLTTTLNAYKLGAIAKVSDELVLDSAFDILGFVAQSAGQSLAIAQNTSYVAGASGSTTTPEGLFTKATVGYTLPVGNTTSITYNGLVELYHSVRPAYRSRGEWVASDTAIKLLRELTDSQQRPLWQPALIAGEPDTLFGQAIYADPDVAVPAANALCVGFGDVSSAYFIRDVQDVTVKILNELYAGSGQVGYRIHKRTDGDIVDTLAFKTLKNSAT